MSSIKVPYILTCQVTGIQKSYTSVEFVKRKIDNYGGDEAAMVAGYVCKDAKRELKAFDLANLTEADVQSVITKLGGTTSAAAVLDLIKSGKLFLTKKVKVRTDGKKDAAGASKKKGKKAAKKPAKKAKKAKTARKPRKSAASTEPASEPSAPAATDVTPASEPAATVEPTTEVAPQA
jgi:hypothetical protein